MAVFSTIPDFKFTKAEFELKRSQTSQDSNARASDVMQIGADYWIGDVEVVCLTDDEFRATRGFLMSLDGETNSFLMTVPRDEAARDGSITSDAGLGVSGVDAGNRTVTLTGAGTGEARVGDKISYYTNSGGYWLGEVVANATPSTGTVTISVTPEPVAPHPTTPAPRRLNPLGEWKLTDLDAPNPKPSDRKLKFKIEQKLP